MSLPLCRKYPFLAPNFARNLEETKTGKDINGVYVKKILSILVAVGLCLGATQVATAKSKAPAETVYFSVGQSKLTKSTKASLSALAKTLKSTDTVDVRGYVQVSGNSKNDISLSAARANKVKAYLVALGVKSKITSKGYGLPKSKRSLAESRRVDIYVTKAAVKPKPSASPSQSPTALGSISGTIQRAGCRASDDNLEYVKLYQGVIEIATINEPAWSNNAEYDCQYDYSFQGLPDGTYTVQEEFQRPSSGYWDWWAVTSAVPGPWTVVATETLRQSHKSPDIVVSGGQALTGIDFRMNYND